MQMKEVADLVKSKNGDSSISQKDMLWYLVGRVDDLHEKLSAQVSSFNKNFLPRNTFWKITSFFIVLLGGLAYYVFLR